MPRFPIHSRIGALASLAAAAGLTACGLLTGVVAAAPDDSALPPTSAPSSSASPSLSAIPSPDLSAVATEPRSSATPVVSQLVQVVSPEHAPRRFVVLGDSLSAWAFFPGTLVHTTTGAWPELLDSLSDDLVLVHNAGKPGNLTWQMVKRLNRDVYAYAPDVLFVLGGTNDIGSHFLPADIAYNLQRIVHSARGRGIEVIVLTIPPNNSLFHYEYLHLLETNTAIKQMAAAEGVRCIDVYSALAKRGGGLAPAYAARDHLHLTLAGEQQLADTVYRAIYPATPELAPPGVAAKPAPKLVPPAQRPLD